MTSLVGHSGAGKSSLLNLIPRFYDKDAGDIKIDDQSIYEAKIISGFQLISSIFFSILFTKASIYNGSDS